MRFVELHVTGGRVLVDADAVVSVVEWIEEGRAANAIVNTDNERYHVLETYDEIVGALVAKNRPLVDRVHPDRVITLVDDPLAGDKLDVCIVSKLGALTLSARSAETLWAQLGHILLDGEKP